MRNRHPLIALAASLVLAGSINACAAETDAEEEDVAAGESALTGKVAAKTALVVTCDFTYLQKTAKKGNPVAGLGKGRALTALKAAAPTNGFYNVKEENNDKTGWVLGSCVKKGAGAAPKTAKDAGAPKEPAETKDAGSTPASTPTEEKDEATTAPAANFPTQGTQQDVGEDKTTSGDDDDDDGDEKKPETKRATVDQGGCTVGRGAASSPAWLGGVLLALAAIARRRSTRA